LIFTTYAGMDIGRDNGGVVDLAYENKAPYAFTGTLKQVVFDLKPGRTRRRRLCTSTIRLKPSRPASPANGRGTGRLALGRRDRGIVRVEPRLAHRPTASMSRSHAARLRSEYALGLSPVARYCTTPT